MAPTRKPRIGKNRKKSWRKHSEIKDVEDFLEDQRVDERTGKRFGECKDNQLFVIDSQGTKKKKKRVVIKRCDQFKNKKLYREYLRTKPLTCFSSLVNTSAVDDPIKKRNRVRTPEEKKAYFKKKYAKHLNNKIPQPKHKPQREIRSEKGIQKRKELDRKKNNFEFDLWDDEDRKKKEVFGSDYAECLRPDVVGHLIVHTKKIGKVLTTKKKKKEDYIPSTLPAIETPHPGISYNPSFEDHTDLLNEVVKAELKVMNHEKWLKSLSSKTHKISVAELEKRRMEELMQGLPGNETEKDSPPTESEAEEDSTPVKQPARKTIQKRKRLRKARLEEQQRLKLKIEKKKLSDLYRLRFLKEDVEEMENKLIADYLKREDLKEMKVNNPKRLAIVKYRKPDVVFTSKEDLTGNLLDIESQGSILFERYKSLQRRNMLLPPLRERIMRKKVKGFRNKSHMMDNE